MAKSYRIYCNGRRTHVQVRSISEAGALQVVKLNKIFNFRSDDVLMAVAQ